jgi:RES domain
VSAPSPPADIASRTPLLVPVPASTDLYRFYSVIHEPIFFDRSDLGRLNAPDGTYGVLYASATARGAFAETFLRTPGFTLLERGQIQRKGCIRFRVRRQLRMVMLYGPGLARIGATAEVTHGGLPYTIPQRWSSALHAHPTKLEGIAYRARHDDDELCYAIFDRVGAHLEEVQRETELLNQNWFYELFDVYGVGLVS